MDSQKQVGIILIIAAVLLIIVLSIIKINTDNEGAFLCSVVEASPDLTMADCPAHSNPSSWYIVVAFAVAALILAAGAYLYLHPHKKEKLDKKTEVKVDTGNLSEEEKIIYNLLKTHDGTIYQSDIIRQTGWTKVKVSRILDRLEGRHLLERRRRGMTNIIILKSL